MSLHFFTSEKAVGVSWLKDKVWLGTIVFVCKELENVFFPHNRYVIFADVAVCTKQCSLSPESMAENGSIRAVREGDRTTHVGDVHARGDSGLHHITARICPCHC